MTSKLFRKQWLQSGFQVLVVLALMLSLFGYQPAEAASSAYIKVIGVVPDSLVTVRTYNFPAGKSFQVFMGAAGTQGVGGTLVAGFDSVAGSETMVFEIASTMHGASKIDLRVSGDAGAFYTTFDNVPSAPVVTGTGYGTGGPVTPLSFSIDAVVPGSLVTITTQNFPAGKSFHVTMGKYGTGGLGYSVANFDSLASAMTIKLEVPVDLKNEAKITVRMEADGGYLAYETFNNVATSTSSSSAVGIGGPTTGGTFSVSVTGVVPSGSVTILARNLPANQTFSVRMGPAGSQGVGGTLVASFDTGTGGDISATFELAAPVRTAATIDLRIDSAVGSAFVSFANAPFSSSSSGTTTVGIGGPVSSSGGFSFAVLAVVPNSSVTIKTFNAPANTNFQVFQGAAGTEGVGGTLVASFDTGAGGTIIATFEIAAPMFNASRIDILLVSSKQSVFNWFWNTASGSGGSSGTPDVTPTTSSDGTPSAYSGIPTFDITHVVKDASVSVKTNNFPADKEFTVRMGLFGTKGIDGTVVGTAKSDGGGSLTFSFTIPPTLFGKDRIAIRMDAPGGYYAYDWFTNADL